MDSTVSLTKGCFAFKTTGKKKRKSIKNGVGLEEPWYKIYGTLKEYAEKKQNEFYKSVYGEFIKEIVDYVSTGGKSALEDVLELVPAAMILPGMALADHPKMFSYLISEIKENVTGHVALIKGKDCSSIKVAVESVVRQLTTKNKYKINKNSRKNKYLEDESSSSDEEEDFQKELKKSMFSFPSLSQWYSDLTKNTVHKNGKYILGNEKKPLVIIVSDVEGSSPSILQDFIYLSKNYIKSLPIVLVFSIATAPSLLGRYISEHALSCLSFKYIYAPSSFSIVPEMVKELSISQDTMFRIGGRPLKTLVNTFFSLDNSVSGFMRMYQFCLMEHFYANPVNALCCPLTDLKGVIKSFCTSELEAIRQLPSFRKYVEKKPPKERAPLLLDDAHLKKVVYQLITNLHARLWDFHIGVDVLNALTSNLPGSPFGCQFHETYIKASTKDITSTAEFDEVFKLLKLMSQEEFMKKMQGAYKTFEDSVKNCPGTGSILKDIVSNMKDSLDKMIEDEQENDELLASHTCGPRKSKSSLRVLQDAPKNICGAEEERKQKVSPPQSPAKKTQNHKIREIMSEPSSPSRSPRKSNSRTPIKELCKSPPKRACPQIDAKNSCPRSPLKTVAQSPSLESPRKGNSSPVLKIPEDTSTNPQYTPKDASKETLDDFELSAGKMNRNQLRERLLLLSKQKKEVLAKEELKYQALKDEILKHLRKALTLALGEGSNPLSSFPLYEIAVFEDVAALRCHLIPPSPQAALHYVLSNPKQYLECDCCTLPDQTSILPTLPDVCIAYKLHLECGRMINLYDWLQAFSMIINSNEDEDKDIQIDVNMQARFMQAVAELQFMGFVKSTKRKTDHVVRLTWGGLTS